MNQPGREPEPTDLWVDDLGLTADQWDDLMVAYRFGTMEPAEGSVEEEAFRRIAAQDWREAQRREESDLLGEAYHRYIEQPFPGGPVTASLTSHEAAELSCRLFRGERAAWRAVREVGWRSPEHAQAACEISDTYRDVKAETIISGLRRPGETAAEFKRRAEREPTRMPELGLFDRLGRPTISHADTETDMEPDMF